MKQDDSEKTPEDRASEGFERRGEPESPKPARLEGPQTDRVQRALRRTSIWLGIVAIVFFAGAVTDHYLRYRPLSAALSETRTALARAQQDVADLQAEIDQLNTTLRQNESRVASLERDEEALREQLANAETRLLLMQVLADVDNARVALSQEDVEGAQTALQDTPQRLEDLIPQIEEINPNLAGSLPQRLTLILSGLERENLETVNIDMELFIQDLLDIERALVSG
jgi:hypothetical protein